jgi:hypothetical protein
VDDPFFAVSSRLMRRLAKAAKPIRPGSENLLTVPVTKSHSVV